MIDSRMVQFNPYERTLISSKPGLTNVSVSKITDQADIDNFMLTVNVPRIAVFHDRSDTNQSNILMIFKRLINENGKKESELVSIYNGKEANHIWKLILGDAK